MDLSISPILRYTLPHSRYNSKNGNFSDFTANASVKSSIASLYYFYLLYIMPLHSLILAHSKLYEGVLSIAF